MLYADEAGETLLLDELGYTLIESMRQHPQKVLSNEELAGLVAKFFAVESDIDGSKHIADFMQSLSKMHLVKVVTS